MTADAVVRTFWYSGKLALPSGVLARARSSPPVSAMTGGIKLRGPERVRIHRRVSRSWIRTEASRAAAVRSSSATQPRADLCEEGLKRKGRLRGRVSEPERLLYPDGPSSRSSVPYIQHTVDGSGSRSSTPITSASPGGTVVDIIAYRRWRLRAQRRSAALRARRTLRQ